MKPLAIGVVLVGVIAGASHAQQAPARGQTQAGPQTQKPALPADMIPPPGMCRIWLKDVPAKQQPAPTNCATAMRTKPANAYLYYGDDYAKKTPTSTMPVPGSSAIKSLVSPQSVAPAVKKPPIKPPGGGGG
jgi:hypothetical protein